MVLRGWKKFFRSEKDTIAPASTIGGAAERAHPKKASAQKDDKPKKRALRRPRAPYRKEPHLEKQVIADLSKKIREKPKKFRTDRATLFEIADSVLSEELKMPRPQKLKAHDVFTMFWTVRRPSKKTQGSPCHEWQGSVLKGAPVLTTLQSQAKRHVLVDARKYIVENPAGGKRRNFRTVPENMCGNPFCVNTKHIRMVRKNPLSHQGENHPRAKFSDSQIVRMVKEFNAGKSAKEVAEKWGIHTTYVKQIMEKKKRTEATRGLKIRGRFGFK